MPKQLKTLDLNDKVKLGKHQVNEETPEPIIWRVVAKNHQCEPAYPDNSVTLQTQKVIDKRAIDAVEVNNPDNLRKQWGSNRYQFSNLSQWLNSNAIDWYKPQHAYDMPPDSAASCYGQETFFAHRPGFLVNFSTAEQKRILNTSIRVTKNISIDGGGYEDFVTKIFLPSRTEVGLPDENGIPEGALWPVYSTENESRIAYPTEQCWGNSLAFPRSVDSTGPDIYRLRTAIQEGTGVSYMIDKSGEDIGGMSASGLYGIRPALNLSGDLYLSDALDEDGCYTVILNDPPFIDATPSGDLGRLAIPLKQNYIIKEVDGDELTITERLNGVVHRTLTSQSKNTLLTFDLSDQWDELECDVPHTASIEVTDGIFEETVTWTFEKVFVKTIVTDMSLALADDRPNTFTINSINTLEGQPPRIQVLIANNALDDKPAWEDVTHQVFAKSLSFKNESKTADQWRVAAKFICNDVPFGVVYTTTEDISIL